MWKNYLKVAFRQLIRSRSYVLLNVLGIGIALGCCIIAYLNWKFDVDFDRFHEKRDQIYRVTTYKQSNGQLYGISPWPLASRAQEEIAGVDKAVRFHYRSIVVKKDDQVFNERVHFVDPAFLDIFTYPVEKGNPTALTDISQVMLTPETAVKYFGQDDPIGKTLTVYAGEDYSLELTVGAILKKSPRNTSMPFQFLTHIENLIKEDQPIDPTDWREFADATFLLMKKGTPTGPVAEALNRYVPIQNQQREDWTVKQFALEPFTEAAHNSRTGTIRSNYLWPSLPESAVWGPIVMALLLLITACLNFTNTSVSLADRRLREMGIRKVMGGTQRQLITQLLGENLLICSLGLLAGIVIAELLIPPYNRMWPYLYLEADYLANLPLVIFLAGMLLLTTILGGAYPAFYISSFNPVNIFRRKVRFGGANWFTRIMLGIQVTISLTAIIGGIAFAQNAVFQEKVDLGYDRKALIGVPIQGESDFQTLTNELKNNPKILAMAGTYMHIGHLLRRSEIESEGQPYEALTMDVGSGYLDLMDLEVVSGRAFDTNQEIDREAVLVNEKLVAEFGWENPIGREIIHDSTRYTVAGIVRDFVQNSLFSPITPVVIRMTQPANYRYLVIRTRNEDLLAGFEFLRKEWSERFPDRPFNGFYQDEVLAESLLVTNNIKWMFLFFALVTILLAATGQFALVSLNVLRRMKEIAIRRIVGASSLDIAVLVNKHFLWIFLVAAVIGCIGGAFLARMILDSIFPTNVGIQLLMLILAAAGILAISSFILALRIRRAVRVNPAEVLKNE